MGGMLTLCVVTIVQRGADHVFHCVDHWQTQVQSGTAPPLTCMVALNPSLLFLGTYLADSLLVQAVKVNLRAMRLTNSGLCIRPLCIRPSYATIMYTVTSMASS